MKIAAVIQARMASSRLPGKVLKKIKDKPVLEHIIERLKLCKNLDHIVVATSNREKNNKIISLCQRLKINTYRDSEMDVLERFVNTMNKYKIDVLVRITGDDLFIDWKNIDQMIDSHLRKQSDLTYTDGMPLGCGLGMIVVSKKALMNTYNSTEKKHPRYREHIDEFILDNPEKFKINILKANKSVNRPDYRLTLDTKEDMKLMKIIFKNLYKEKPIELSDVIRFLDKNKNLLKLNAQIKQK